MAPPQGPPPGPPPFEPPLPVLTSMSTSIQSALKDYENATSPQEKAAALLDIKTASTKLSAATTDLPDRFLGLVFGPMQNIAVRIAIEMGLFNAVPMAGNISLADLAAKTKSDEEFVLRITRTLVAFNILSESEEGRLSHTQFSGFLTIGPAQALIKHVLQDVVFAHINSVDKYYAEYGFKSPEDYKNCPIAVGFGKKDMDCFEIFESLPGHMEVFAEAMTLTGMFGLDPVIATYPFNELAPNADGVKLVDVGGGKGHFLVDIQEKYPEVWTKGSLVLEDLKNVLDGGVLVTDTVKVQPYNFLEEVQPVKG